MTVAYYDKNNTKIYRVYNFPLHIPRTSAIIYNEIILKGVIYRIAHAKERSGIYNERT